MNPSIRRIDVQSLRDAVAELIAAAGSSPDEAQRVAGNLVEANLQGHDSHGVGMVPRYVDAVAEGGLLPNAKVRVEVQAGALLRLDGMTGYGQSVGEQAIEMGIAVARTEGVCVVALANAHHLGRIGHWAERCIEADLVSVHFVNVLARPIVAPHAGRDARLGTNPFCVGVPRPGGEPIVLDFATSRIAQGKARVAHNKGDRLEAGMLLDDAGEPTRDPRYAVVEPTGALLPFGEHKGSGLALVCELLGGALTGGATWRGASDGRRQVLNGMLSILIDPRALGTAAHLARETEAFVQWYAASPPAAGVSRVLVAGEPERATRRQRLAGGVPIDAATWAELVAAAARVGLPPGRFEGLASPGA